METSLTYALTLLLLTLVCTRALALSFSKSYAARCWCMLGELGVCNITTSSNTSTPINEYLSFDLTAHTSSQLSQRSPTAVQSSSSSRQSKVMYLISIGLVTEPRACMIQLSSPSRRSLQPSPRSYASTPKCALFEDRDLVVVPLAGAESALKDLASHFDMYNT